MDGRGARVGERNVSTGERIASVTLGGGLLAYAMMRRGLVPKLIAIPAIMLLARGGTGHSILYALLEVSTAEERRGRRAAVRRPQAGVAASSEPAYPLDVGPVDVIAHSEPGPGSPRPGMPRTHEHPEPESELGEPGVRATPRLMHEVSASPPPG